MPASVVYGAGKGLGQIEQEQEAFERGMEKAQLELQQQQVRNQRVSTALQHISQGRSQRDARSAQASQERVNAGIRETEAERYKSETIENKRRYEKEFEAGITESARQREVDIAKMQGAGYKPTTFEEAVRFDQAKKKTTKVNKSTNERILSQAMEGGVESLNSMERNYYETKILKDLPKGYAENLQSAVKAVQNGEDPWEVYQTMASIPGYAKKSAELKRILMPSGKEDDLESMLWGK
jgi:hypothetical protein